MIKNHGSEIDYGTALQHRTRKDFDITGHFLNLHHAQIPCACGLVDVIYCLEFPLSIFVVT